MIAYFSSYFHTIRKLKIVTEGMFASQTMKLHTVSVITTRVMSKDNLFQVEI